MSKNIASPSPNTSVAEAFPTERLGQPGPTALRFRAGSAGNGRCAFPPRGVHDVQAVCGAAIRAGSVGQRGCGASCEAPVSRGHGKADSGSERVPPHHNPRIAVPVSNLTRPDPVHTTADQRQHRKTEHVRFSSYPGSLVRGNNSQHKHRQSPALGNHFRREFFGFQSGGTYRAGGSVSAGHFARAPLPPGWSAGLDAGKGTQAASHFAQIFPSNHR